jgi:hypothetical protein
MIALIITLLITSNFFLWYGLHFLAKEDDKNRESIRLCEKHITELQIDVERLRGGK